MATVTEFGYSWDGDFQLERFAHEQVAAMVEAVQTKRRDISWPAKVRVSWTTIDLASVGHPDRVGITLAFWDERTRLEISEARLSFQFPKVGVREFVAAEHLHVVLKN